MFLRNIFIFFLCIFVFTAIPSECKSEPPQQVAPSKTDTVLISFLCRHEKIIMKLSQYDSTSIQLAAQYFFVATAAGECVRFDKPSLFKVEEILAEYKDYAGDEMLILKVSSLSEHKFDGYVMVIKNIFELNAKGSV